MQAIILAAGRGSRLKSLTDDTPKCMMTIQGKTLLQRQLDAYHAHGVEHVAVVRGYLAERIQPPGATLYLNPAWETTGLLPSLMCAAPSMAGGFFFSYGDTTFDPQHVKLLKEAMQTGGYDMAGIVDVDWLQVYAGRDWHPPTEAENVTVDDTGRILRLGKNVPGEGSLGEFTGLGALSARAAELLQREVARLEATLTPADTWGQKGTLRMAYVADILQHLIDHCGLHMQAVPVHGGVREVDTPEDLARAEEAVGW